MDEIVKLFRDRGKTRSSNDKYKILALIEFIYIHICAFKYTRDASSVMLAD